MIYAKVVDSFQHAQLLKAWNTDNEEEITNQKEENNNIDIEGITKLILKVNEEGVNKIDINYHLENDIIANLQKKGFSIKDTSPIEKLKGLYHIISW